MAFDVTSTLSDLKTMFTDLGDYTGDIMVGEPKVAPPEKSVAIWMISAETVELTLSKSVDLLTAKARIYWKIVSDTATKATVETVENEINPLVTEVMATIMADYDVGATIRQVDSAGEQISRLRGEWLNVTFGASTFRCADITIPMIVDDSATLTP